MTEPFDIPFALVDQWDEMIKTKGKCATYYEIALWGANQELEACCEWAINDFDLPVVAEKLRANRRPPTSEEH